jgi:hypothetical protein
MGLEKNLNFFENVVDVMVQTKRSLEDTIHLDTNIKRFKEMTKAPKKKKKIESKGLDSKIF